MKWSLTLPRVTMPSNSGCLSTSRLTVSFLGLSTTHSLCPDVGFCWIRITPGAKQDANFSHSGGGIGS